MGAMGWVETLSNSAHITFMHIHFYKMVLDSYMIDVKNRKEINKKDSAHFATFFCKIQITVFPHIVSVKTIHF